MARNRKLIAAGCFILAAFIAAISHFSQKQFYRSCVTVAAEVSGPDFLNTHKRIIKNRRNAYYVFKKLKLAGIYEFRKAKDPLVLLLNRVGVGGEKDGKGIRITACSASPELAMYIAGEFAGCYIKALREHGVVNNVKIIDVAKTSKYPFRPNKKFNIILSIIAGFAAGMTMIFSRKGGNVFTAKESGVLPNIGSPILGVVPVIKKISGKAVAGEKDLLRIVEIDPYSLSSEAFRSIRGNLLFYLGGFSAAKSILVTSAVPREGKTITAVNLALISANSGERVLLVDANIERPKLHFVFNKDNRVGLFNFLSDEGEDFDKIVSGPERDNLSIVTCGRISDRMAELVFPQRIEIFLEKAAARFSKIFFDGPAISQNSCLKTLCGASNSVVLVADRRRVTNKSLDRSKESVKLWRGNLTGVVINNEEVLI